MRGNGESLAHGRIWSGRRNCSYQPWKQFVTNGSASANNIPVRKPCQLPAEREFLNTSEGEARVLQILRAVPRVLEAVREMFPYPTHENLEGGGGGVRKADSAPLCAVSGTNDGSETGDAVFKRQI